MKNISIVQAVIFSVAVLAIITAVAMFALYKGKDAEQEVQGVVVWGYVSSELFSNLLNVDGENDPAMKLQNITYIQKSEETFEDELVSALAEGSGPDIVLLRENQVILNRRRLLEIPYGAYDLRTYQETFIEEANLLTTNNGYIGIPFMVDPLVLYYNKDILNSNGIARPPKAWTELLSVVPQLTDSSPTFNISKSAIALGDFSNIRSAKEIIWSIIMQAGGQVIIKSFDPETQTDVFYSDLNENNNYANSPAQTALNFYTQFSNPSKTSYSWNRSLPYSDEYFLAGNSAFYLGFASELPVLRTKNPNLNFDVAEIPQPKDAVKKTTYGKMYFLAIAKNTQRGQDAFNTMLNLTEINVQNKLSIITGLPSVRRDLLTAVSSGNSFDVVFKKSALYSYGVLEPQSQSASTIVQKMLESIISGELDLDKAIQRADSQFENELGNQ